MRFPMIGIGASAGGLEAISELITALPAQSGTAVIVVQHLDPDHQSLLAEILRRTANCRVVQAEDGMTVMPDHIYVIAPNTTLALQADRFQVTRRAPGPHHPVDIFFSALAESRGESAIGVVLSGGDADGTLGIQTIKHHGGITFAQEPTSARVPSMPQSAIASGCVDFVLRPEEIALELIRLNAHSYLRSSIPGDGLLAEPAEIASSEDEEDRLRRIFAQLRRAHGVDFAQYKRSTLRRRLARRMAVRRMDDLESYVALIERDPVEATALYQDFLIRVTGFFRHPDAFEGLKRWALPRLCEGRSSKDPIRIWVAGCATGEEVYSMAIVLTEYLGETTSLPVQLFGTDVSEAAIDKARAGLYLENIAEDVSSERLARFFVKVDHHYRVAKSIRDLCIFARQDVTRDPPFSRLDLVSCRNLLIYLDAGTQQRVMQVFRYALRRDGFLMLGPSESVGQAGDLFELAEPQYRFFSRRSGVSGTTAVTLPPRTGAAHARSHDDSVTDVPFYPDADSAQREADHLLLARFAPPSLVVDDALNILQFRGETGPYLEHASGPSSLHLSRVARTELFLEISSAIQEASERDSQARREGLRLDERQDITIEVSPLRRNRNERCFLIVFDDGSRRSAERRHRQVPAHTLPESEKDLRLAQLDSEVTALRVYLQATLEGHEAVKEEIRSAHEEVLSANEEFQSTNEELETSKEELQSINEELNTTNDELRNRNRELAVLNAELEKARASAESAKAYAEAIIEAVSRPLVVLDGRLRIVRGNQAYYTNFQISREAVEGQLFYEVNGGRWDTIPVRNSLQSMLDGRAPSGLQEVAAEFPVIGDRVMSLNIRKIPGDGERTDLLLVAIDDITERRARSNYLQDENRLKDEFLAMLAHELRNPLMPITNAIRLLKSTDAVDERAKLDAMIERQTSKLSRLVDDLLDVARSSRGILQLKNEEIELATIVKNAAYAVQWQIEQSGQELSISVADVPVRIRGDALRLEQVVANLLDNASKYTNRGGRIELSLTRSENSAIVRVSDNGVGIAPDMVEKIFDVFTQVTGERARSRGGLGLGLAVVQRVLQLHGASIEVHSAGLGRGSDFIVRLPLTEQIDNDRRTTEALKTVPSSGMNLQSRRVLVVDDNHDAAESLAMLVSSWGHEVEIAPDGPSALTIADFFRPQSAIVDIGLPGMNGYDLARRLRASTASNELQLLAVTGYGRAEDLSKAHAAGFDVHLVKPVDIDKLEQLIARGPGRLNS